MFYTPNEEEYTNTWISMNYVKKWGIWEGIREILQNQFDGITSIIGKINIDVVKKPPEKNGVKYQFDFIRKGNPNEKFGQIQLNEVNNKLTVWNQGKLETGDLLLGGTKDILNNEEIIGRFGEGMKLAALAFVRKGKRFSIITDGKMWTFIQKIDNKFIKNGQPQLCLHWREDICDSETYKNKVTIEISPFTLDEWLPYIDNFLWLTQRSVGRIEAKENGKVIGQLLYNDFFKYKIYVKDIFVQETEKEEPNDNHGATNCYFGFNTDLELDRDRNAVKNLDERNRKFSQILGDIMNRRNSDEILNNLNPVERLKFTEEFPKQIIYLLEHCYYTSSYINRYLTTESRNAIWNQKVLEDQPKRTGCNIIYSSYLGYFQHWMTEKKLPASFYPYFLIYNAWIWDVLVKSSYYKNYEQLYNEKILSSPEANEPPNLKNVIDNIVQIIRNINPNFNRNNIKFKNYGNDFQDDVVCFNNNILYFSNKLGNANIDRIKKFWMLESVCHFFKINAMKLLINSSNLFQ